MGCGGSKVDDLPLVTLCRDRKKLIKDASDHRYALAAAHLAYFHSLRDVGEAIRRFVDEELVIASPGSPVLTLPSQEGKSKSSSPSTSISHSLDGGGRGHKAKRIEEDEDIKHSHLHLSDSDGSGSDTSDSGHIHIHNIPEEDDEKQAANRNGPSTSYEPNSYPPFEGSWGYAYPGEENPTPYPGEENSTPYPNPFPFPFPYTYPNSYPTAYYMKKSPTPARTVVYEDPNLNGRMGSAYYGGYFENPMMGGGEPSPPKPPPAPPSPPRVSAWDFFNVFEGYDNSSGAGGYPWYYSTGRYSSTSSPDSKEVREREGIPDLEDEMEQDVIKEAYKVKKKAEEEGGFDPKLSSSNGEPKTNFEGGTSKSVPLSTTENVEHISKGKGIKTSASPDMFRHSPDIVSKSSPEEGSVRKKSVSFEVEDGSTGTVDAESSSKPSSLTTLSTHGSRDLHDVVKEIRDEFESATSYGKEVALMLEIGKLPHHRRSSPLKVILSRILYLVSSRPPARPPMQVSSRVVKIAKSYSGEVGNHVEFPPRNLSTTLEKIYEWEKKLYKEVKDEERLRVIYEKKCKRLKILDERGVESTKIDAEQASTRKVLMKINVCVRAIDSISSKIHKLRDEELQPQISELIQRLIRMWKSMLRCHQKQFQALMESKIRSLRVKTGAQTDSGLRATLDLEMELVNWATRFNIWMSTQKSYIESLHGWLSKCIIEEAEETADGFAPFSPSRVGAPPIFVICNDWFQAMERISEKEVENTMFTFASRLHELWERQDEEQRRRIKAEYLTRDFEKQLRTLRMERERIEQEQDAALEKSMSKVPSESGVSPLDDLKVDLDSMTKKLAEERARHKEAAKLVHDAASSSVQAGLVPIFEALGNFSSEVLKAHEQVRLDYTGGR